MPGAIRVSSFVLYDVCMDILPFTPFGTPKQNPVLPPFRDPNKPTIPQMQGEYGLPTQLPQPAQVPGVAQFEPAMGQTQEQANQAFLESNSTTRFFSDYANQIKTQAGLEGNPIEGEQVGALEGTVRSVASLFDPLTLSQDILFSVMGGRLDPNKTVWENLREMEWAKYAPGGATPKRVVDGADLMKLFGVEDEKAARLGGIAMDFVADPLLLGGAITALGKIGKVEKLVELGTKVDKAMSLRGMFTGLSKIPVPSAEGMSNLGQYYTNMSEHILNTYRNPYGKILGLDSYKIKKVVDNNLAKSVSARLALGEFGVDVFKKLGLGEQRADDIYEETVESIAELNNSVFGKESKNWLRKAFSIVGEAGNLEKNLVDVPTIVRNSIFKEAYELVGRRGFLLSEGSTVDNAFDYARTLVGETALREAGDDLTEVAAKVSKLAAEYGVDATVAQNKFKQLVSGLTQIDAKLGYHASGYEFIRTKFHEAVIAAGESIDTATAMWQEVLRRGINGTDITKLDFDGLINQFKTRGRNRPDYRTSAVSMDGRTTFTSRNTRTQGRGPGGRFTPYIYENSVESVGGFVMPNRVDGFNFATRELPGPAAPSRTVGDILQGVETFSSLPINTYLQNLKNGHMRRAFGLFASNQDFDAYISNLSNGKIVVSNIIDELNLVDVLGKEREDIANYIKEYQSTLRSTSTKGRSGGKMGVMMTQAELARHLVESQMRNGVSKGEAVARARASMLDIQRASSSNLDPIIDELQKLKISYTGVARDGVGSPGQAAFGKKRDDEIDESVLNLLGEFANPIISIYEQAGAAKKAIAPKEFLRQTYEIASRGGHIKEGDSYVDGFGVVYVKVPENSLLGAFSGKLIHPYLYEQITKGIASKNKHIPLQHLRSMITGGYLASPNVVTANFVGGLFSAALHGINPVRMVGALASVFPELRYSETSQWMERLKKHINVSGGSVVTQDATKEFANLRLEEAALNGSFRSMLEGFTRFFDKQLQAPITGNTDITGWAGLSGFQFVEKWFKVATFKTEFERLVATGLDAAVAEARAAEKARTVVFDYSELPDLIQMMRDYGLLLFPGYPFFLAGRTLGALMDRPGVLATADKLSEGITNAFLDEEEKYAFYAHMPEWMKKDQGVPFEVYVDDAGNKVTRVIPLGQMVPTNGFDGTSFAESLMVGGVWRPFLELLSAVVSGDGEQSSAKYGTVVFTPESSGLGRVGEIMQFLYSSLAPSALKKVYTPVAGNRDKGLIPSLMMPGNLGDMMYSFSEVSTGKVDREFRDALLSILVRSPMRVALSGPLAAGEYKNARFQHNEQIQGLRERYLRFVSEGKDNEAQKILKKIDELNNKFVTKWKELLEYQQAR